jgi:hypothetical protein
MFQKLWQKLLPLLELKAFKEALSLRGSRVIDDRPDYQRFLSESFAQRNGGHTVRLTAERLQLRDLPARRVVTRQRYRVRVTQASTIRVRTNTYTVPSRMIDALVEVYLTPNCLEVWRGDERVERLPRIRGRHQRLINVQHVIGWLMSDPRALAAYPYRDALFPTSRFRRAYSALCARNPYRAREKYFRILFLTANGCTAGVDAALGHLLEWGAPINLSYVEEHLRHFECIRRATKAAIPTAHQSTEIFLGGS